jgi:hypothetical protein
MGHIKFLSGDINLLGNKYHKGQHRSSINVSNESVYK